MHTLPIFMRRLTARVLTINTSLPTLVLCTMTAAAVAGQPTVVPDRLLVKAKPHLSEAAVHQLFTSLGANQGDAIQQIGVRIVRVPEARRATVLKALQHNPNIEFAEEDCLLEPDLVPNDTYYSYAWHLPKIQAPQTWDTTTGSSTVTIAILDSGVEGTHPDLVSLLLPGWNFYNNNPDTTDVNGHGTAVAGTAAAASNNGIGVAAVTWNCRLMPIRIADANGYGLASAIASGLTWAADRGARVANISYGNVTKVSSINSAAQYFQSKGGVVTVSAGNDGIFDATADNPNFLMVSATDANDALTSWSNAGNNIDLAAPGLNIVTTGVGASYGYASGTSFSAPVVAGVAALVFSVNSNLSGVQVQEILKQNADDLGTPGWDPSYGYGRVNAYKAVLAAAGSPSPADTTAPTATVSAPSNGSTVSGTVLINVSASDNVGVTKVECYLNGTLAGTSAASPAVFSWDTTTFANGAYVILAKAYDAAGNIGGSASVTVSAQNSVPDVTPPSVQITAPASGATVSGTVSVTVNASDKAGVTKLEWYLDGALAGSASSAPFTFSWDTTKSANGTHTLQAKAYDAAGNVAASAFVTVTVQNATPDTTAPSVQITSPANGAKVARTTKVYVKATDNVGVKRVELYIDGKLNSSSTSSAPVFSWNVSKVAAGQHTLQSLAYDAAGNRGASAIVTVTK